MGAFSDHMKNVGSTFSGHLSRASEAVGGAAGAAAHARGAASGVAGYARQVVGDHKALHGNMPGAREYVASDEGRATLRHAAGSAFHTFLKRKASQHGRKATVGGMIGNALFSFAHHALNSQMTALKHDQRIFQNVARVRRGDPEVQHMSHVELREVHDHAQKYGGPHGDKIREASQGELGRRQKQKNDEHARGIAGRLDAIAEARKGHDEAAHAQHIKQLREIHGHTAAAKVAAAQAVNKEHAKREAIKTKGAQKREALKTKGTAARARIIKMTKSGGAVMAGVHGENYTISASRVKARNGAKSKRGTGAARRPRGAA